MQTFKMLIDGQREDSVSGQRIDSENPYSGEIWATIPRGTVSDVNAAVEAAQRAFRGVWKSYSAAERGRLLCRLADLLRDQADELARIEVRDNGKLLSEMKAQLAYLPKYLDYYGGLADKIEGSVIPNENPALFSYTRREPLGVVVAITAWNSPLWFFVAKAAPALAAGNTLVVKPSEFTSCSLLQFADLFSQAGFPDGVINIVTGFGSEIGDALCGHPKIAKISFTGSGSTGQRISAQAARNLVPVVMELGGKSANIVFSDAHMEDALNGVMAGIFAAGGQTCVAGSRLLLQSSIAYKFVEQLVDKTSKIALGDPLDAATQMGPMANRPHFEKVLDYFKIAMQDGAQLATGGRPSLHGGYFVEPTIYTGVENGMRIAREEVFGPILSVIEFYDDDEAIAIANDSEFGLAAGLWSQDYRRIIRMSAQLEAGTVWTNCYRTMSFATPFGGYKQSGHGREGGIEAMNEFLQTKSICVNSAPSVRNPFIVAVD